jgi:hypothetical protein
VDKPQRPRLTKPKTEEERRADNKALFDSWLDEAKDG